ncbi:MAG TPA: pyridoxamine 5'-phosphate oxidase family protein [Kiritimatiellia bacterium]|nr:pyridoxamine 5'-phosphate oxidase family protein [Kiritimatiellia bacterium]HQQ05046.1 pyridoxamine 5'-phosphate oxidase family protein [Kiritimatiellia bacterium]
MKLDRVREIVGDAGFGMMATSVDGQPQVRAMAFVLLEDGRLWSSTVNISGKVAELKKNSKVGICFLDSRKSEVRIDGIADITGGPDKKKKLLELNPYIKKHFPDENDPKFVHIEIVPTRIRWKNAGFGEYTEVI